MKKLVLSGWMAMALAAPVWADGSNVLVIGNGDERVLKRQTGSSNLRSLQRKFRGNDMSATVVSNVKFGGMRAAFLTFAKELNSSTDDVAIVLTGRFVSTVAGSYLMPEDAVGDLGLTRVLTEGFPLDSVYSVAAQFPGRALVILGEEDSNGDLANGLSADLPATEIPHGVTVAKGEIGNALWLANRLANNGSEDVLPLVRSAGLKLHGFVPNKLALLQSVEEDLPKVVVEVTRPNRIVADRAAWKKAVEANSEAGYNAYLSEFPRGESAAEAKQRINTILSEPFYREKQAEAKLKLSRDARREIQRDLSLLGYNTRGIDGIFGRGSRAAVTAWQNANGETASGFMSADQIARLDAQAERRAAELEEEARQRQAELERQDRSFWAETGARGDEPGYRAYLKRFPDGQYADVAQRQLNAIEAQRSEEAGGQDRARWQAARRADTADAYRGYLESRPNGAFSQEARARIDWLSRNAQQVEIAKRGEAAEATLGLNAGARRLAESRLKALGLEPGSVDGTFDNNTRRAIRRYQTARKLTVSGYLDQPTLVRLMADSILR